MVVVLYQDTNFGGRALRVILGPQNFSLCFGSWQFSWPIPSMQIGEWRAMQRNVSAEPVFFFAKVPFDMAYLFNWQFSRVTASMQISELHDLRFNI